VLSPEGLDRVGGYCGWEWNLGQGPAVRPPESKRAVGLSIDLIALLVHRAMVPATQQGEVREGCWPALRPVANVMAFAERQPATGDAAILVPMVESASQCRRNRPGPRPNFHGARVRLLLAHRRSVPDRVSEARSGPLASRALVQGLAGRGQRSHEQRAHVRLQPASKHYGPVVILVDMQRPARMPSRGLPRFGLAIHAAPAAHDPLDMGHFRSAAVLPPIAGLVRIAGPGSAERHRHSAMPSRKACQAENASGTTLGWTIVVNTRQPLLRL
jgi:hypothetical protein